MQNVVTYAVEGKTVEMIDADLRAAVARHRWRILHTADRHSELQEMGYAFGFVCRIYDICAPGFLAEALSRDRAVAAVLPCRVCLYTQQDRVFLGSVKPAALLGLFDSAAWEAIARQIDLELTAVLDEAAG